MTKQQQPTAFLQGNLQLKQAAFELQSGEFKLPLQGVSVIFGRSGSGKSTLLKAITGLDKNTRGQMSFANNIWQEGAKSLPTQKRNIGFVFQDAALFPHMSVKENLLYAVKRLPKNQIPLDFDDLVKELGITELLERSVSFLSGGEQQRVAIARALLMQPQILCMDEPLSALDWRAKTEIIQLIKKVVKRYQLPVLYITHSPSEVEQLADRIVFMHQGKIERIENLQQALARPDSPLFDDQGAISVLMGQTQPIEDGVRAIQMGDNHMYLCEPQDSKCADCSEKVRVKVVAKDVSLALAKPQDLSIMNQLPATIVELTPSDLGVLVRLELSDGQRLFAEITKHSYKRLNLQTGLQVYALIKSVALAN